MLGNYYQNTRDTCTAQPHGSCSASSVFRLIPYFALSPDKYTSRFCCENTRLLRYSLVTVFSLPMTKYPSLSASLMPTVRGSDPGMHIERLWKNLWAEEYQLQLYPSLVTIAILPDDVLIEIFDFYVDQPMTSQRAREDAWHTLVHVCQRWRRVVFASPRCLNLQLLWTNTRSVQKMLDIWPALPIAISARAFRGKPRLLEITNALVALEHHDRVCSINIQDIPNVLLKEIATIKASLPALTDLSLWSKDQDALVLPDSFLGGSAPRLRKISLACIPFPGLKKLLLSTSDLVSLLLFQVPHSGYIAPDAMVASLSTLPRLEAFCLEFRSPRHRADREHQHPTQLQRVVLPALTQLQFKGDSEYLEDIVSRIDGPLLRRVYIRFFNQLMFYTPQLRYFISRAENFKAPHHADVAFHDDYVGVTLVPNAMEIHDSIRLHLQILCKPSDWQLSSLAQVCDVALPPSTLERLSINDHRRHWEEDVESNQWPELLHPFASVKDLFLVRKSFQLVSPALEGPVEASIPEVLPALRNLFLQGPQPLEPDKETVGKFIAARQLSGCQVTVHHSDGPGRAYRLWETSPVLKARAGSSLSPSELLPDMDDMYKISPGTPTIDAISLHSSPLHVHDSSYLPTRKNVPNGTRKNITPESLVPYDAPIQTRKYRMESSTSRKDLPARFARKRARTQAPGEDGGSVGPTLSEEDAIKAKRLQNTLAARRSRKRKLEYQLEREGATEHKHKEKEKALGRFNATRQHSGCQVAVHRNDGSGRVYRRCETPKQMSFPEGHASAAPMSVNDDTAAQAIMSGLSDIIDCDLLTNSSLTDQTSSAPSPWTYLFSDLATDHGIPQSVPPSPHITSRRSSEPEPKPIPDFSLSALSSNYLTLLASEKTSIPEGHASAASMSADDEAAAQAIASALSASSSDFLNPSNFLMSPVSPWDDLLTTPALDADVAKTSSLYTSPAEDASDLLMTPAFDADLIKTSDVYTSSVLMDFDDDFDNIPSLFGSTAHDDHPSLSDSPDFLLTQ